MGRWAGARPAIDAGGVAVKRVRVDGSKCQGHNRCFVSSPELFSVDDYGYAHERNEGVVPAELEEKAKLAVKNCPERAISITEEQR